MTVPCRPNIDVIFDEDDPPPVGKNPVMSWNCPRGLVGYMVVVGVDGAELNSGTLTSFSMIICGATWIDPFLISTHDPSQILTIFPALSYPRSVFGDDGSDGSVEPVT
jgi:hypothetical protein